MEHTVTVGGIEISNSAPLVVIAGPCQLESRELSLQVASKMKKWCDSLGLPYIFKGSFDKANRTSIKSVRGLGMDDGLEVLRHIKEQVGCPVTTDVHDVSQCAPVAEVVDLLQIPAMLARQTDLLAEAGRQGVPVNIKKGQFMAPDTMQHAADKVRVHTKDYAPPVIFTERGTTFGHHDLVVDMRGLQIMKGTGHPVVMDASHAAQRPSVGATSGGDRGMVPLLARAAVAVGVAGVFIECHPSPDMAMSDGPTSMHLHEMPALLANLMQIDDVVKRRYT